MTATAPPAGTVPDTPDPGSRPNNTVRRVLLTIGTVAIILALAWQGVRLGTLSGYDDHTGTYPITDQVSAVDIRATATHLEVTHGDVSEPVLEFDQDRADMVLRHQVRNGELSVVVEPRLHGLFAINTGSAELRLTLPRADPELDLDVRSTAGEVLLDGEFDQVSLNTTATDIALSGSAVDLSASTTAGALDAQDLAVSGQLTLDATPGDLRVALSEAPQGIEVEATAGEVRFEIPPGDYRIETDATAGRVDQHLPSNHQAERVYTFDVTAGDITLLEAN